MRDIMTDEGAGIRPRIVRNRHGLVRSHHANIKVNQTVAGNISIQRADAMCRVADRAGEPVLRNMVAMLSPARGRKNNAQIVALRAHGVGTLRAQIRRWKSVRDNSAGCGSLAHHIIPFQNVRVDGAMRARRPGSAKFPVVVAVVAIGAEDAGAHQPGGLRSIFIEHVGQQARLRKRAVAVMRHGMAGGGGWTELRHEVQLIAGEDQSRRQVAVFQWDNLLADARSMAPETVLILVHRGGQHSDSIRATHTHDVCLRRPHSGRRRKRRQRIRGMGIVTVDTGGVPVVIKDGGFGLIMGVGPGRQQVRGRLRKFRVHVQCRG